MKNLQNLQKSFKNFKQINPYEANTKLQRPYSARPANFKKITKNETQNQQEKQNDKQKKLRRTNSTTHSKEVQTKTNLELQNLNFSSEYMDRYKSTRSLAQSPQMPKSECFLDKLDLPPVTEIDHQTARCFCRKCTCGKHQCPSNRKETLYPKNMYNSSYKNLFKRIKSALPEQRKKIKQFLQKSNFKMEGKTSKQIDYQPFIFPKDHNPLSELEKNKPTSSYINQKFCSSSQYQVQYPDWGPTYPQKSGPFHFKFNSQDIQLDSRTQYKQNFQDPTALAIKDPQKLIKSSSQASFRKSPFAQSYETPMEGLTQYKKDFQNLEGYKTNNMKRNHNINNYQNPPGSYTSTYNFSFKGQQPTNYYDLRGGRKKLIAF